MSVLSAKDFPRVTRGTLGLPPDANLAEEVDRHIIQAEDHVRRLIGDQAFASLAEDGEANADRRRRFATALHALASSLLEETKASALGERVGSETQGRRSRTVSTQAPTAARAASRRSYGTYVELMFGLGFTVRDRAVNAFYQTTTR